MHFGKNIPAAFRVLTLEKCLAEIDGAGSLGNELGG